MSVDLGLVERPKGALAWYLGCEFACQTCGSIFYSQDDILSHVEDVHGDIDTYLEKNPGDLKTKVIHLKCKICDGDIERDLESLKDHILTHDSLSMDLYREQFQIPKVYNPTETSLESKEEDEEEIVMTKEVSVKLERLNDTDHPRSQAEVSFDEVLEWSSQCEYKCGWCNNLTTKNRKVFERHVGVKHKRNMFMTESKFPDTISKVEHNCKICGKVVLKDTHVLENHLKNDHQTLLHDYYKTHIKTNDSDQNMVVKQGPLIDVEDKETKQGAGKDEKTEKSNNKVDWYKGCVIQCQICKATMTNKGSLSKHLLTHNITMVKYREKYGTIYLKKEYLKCKICLEGMVHEHTSIKSHLIKVHSMSMSNYYSNYIKEEGVQAARMSKGASDGNPWNKCTYKCNICNFSTKTNSFYVHIRKKHGITGAQYTELHGHAMVDKVIHNCRICNARVIWSYVTIERHLKRVHRLSLERYGTKYLNAPTPNSAVKSRGSKSVNQSPVKKKGGKIQGYPWQKCTYQCKICNFTTKNSASFHGHIKRDHELNRAQYTELHGQGMVDKVMYNCKICNKQIICSGPFMTKHMACHNMSVSQYFQKHPETPNEFSETSDSSDEDEDGKYDESWMDLCKFSCMLCQELSFKSVLPFEEHLKNSHNQDYDGFKKLFGNPCSMVRLVECKICEEVIVCERSNIIDHLDHHEIDPKTYYKKYLT